MYSIVILSKNPLNAAACCMGIYQNEPDLPRQNIIIVDDGAREKGEANCPRVTWLDGVKPFIFARNANIGIRHALRLEHHWYCTNCECGGVEYSKEQAIEAHRVDAPGCGGDDDLEIHSRTNVSGVILLNDDAILQTHRGFSNLVAIAERHPEYGIVASSCNNVGNENQLPQHGARGIRREFRMLCFVCVYIKRTVFEAVGLLDERFTGYGFEDDDFSQRTTDIGLKLGVWDGCFVDHARLTSTFRGDGPPIEAFERNRKLHAEKVAEVKKQIKMGSRMTEHRFTI